MIPDFTTTLDRSPADDTGHRLRIVWAVLGSASYAHAYPATRVDRRYHLCQGRYLGKLRDPLTKLPLYSPAQIKTFLKHRLHRVDPVCACCYGILYWFVGDLARQSVTGYRMRQYRERHAERGGK